MSKASKALKNLSNLLLFCEEYGENVQTNAFVIFYFYKKNDTHGLIHKAHKHACLYVLKPRFEIPMKCNLI